MEGSHQSLLPCGILFYSGMGVIMKQLRRLRGAIKEKAKKEFYAPILIDVTIRDVSLVKH